MAVRTRFAPSPTGYLHIGGIRTALFAWAYARHESGTFILRIEDTDKKREVSGALEHTQESLRWLGLDWDEGPDKGEYGPYVQSKRIDIYRRYAQELIEKGLAYADPYSQAEVEAFRNEAKANKQPFLYRNHRPENSPEWDGSQPLRFKIPQLKQYVWQDAVRGELSAGEEALDDFIIIKADGFPTYNFAHVVDDHDMAITHVMRGEEFLSSVPKFLALHDAFGWDYPIFATLPPVLNAQGGKKLSKREGAQDVLTYRDEGYLPDALVNFLAVLGWNDGTEQEVFTPEDIVEKFTLERIQKSGARFNQEKLDWLNWQHFKRRLEQEGARQALASLPAELDKTTGADIDKAASLALSKAGSIEAFLAQLKIFTERPETVLTKDVLHKIDKRLEAAEAVSQLDAALQAVGGVSEFSEENIEEALRSALEAGDYKPRIFLNLTRWAISGQQVSPSLFDMMALLGPEECQARLEAARDKISVRSAEK